MSLTIPQQLRNGLVAYWPLADGSAIDLRSALYDGRGPYDLTNNNTVTRADGPSNNLPNAAGFVGASSQYLSNSSFPDFGNLPFTVWGWVYLDNVTGAQEFIGKFGGAGNRAWLLRNSGGAIQLLIGSDGTNLTNVNGGLGGHALVNGTWSLVFAWHDPARGIAAVQEMGNGNAPQEAAFTGPVFASTNDLLIGASGATPGNFMTGRLGEWNVNIGRVLTTYEKDWLYNNGQGRDLLRGV